MVSGSKFSILGAILANVLIAVSKFTASFFTGSSAMVAEGIHSLIDTSNGLLMLLGLKRSKKPSDHKHPFGYGKEVYFWSFVVSILISSIGAGFAIWQGIHHLKHPNPIKQPLWNYIVLAVALVFESISLFIAFRNFKRVYPKGTIIKNIYKSRNPSNFTVLIEDTATVLGLVIAILGVYFSVTFQNPNIDGYASIAIGVLLLIVASFLAHKTKALLLGESANEKILQEIKTIFNENPQILTYNTLKAVHFGPRTILVVAKIEIEPTLNRTEVELLIKYVTQEILEKIPKIKHVFLESYNPNN